MKSNVCYLFDGKGIEDVLGEVEKTAKYCELDHKQLIYLRLLSEEMVGMVNNIVEDYEAKFWIQTRYNTYELHMNLEFLTDAEKRKQLMDIAASDKKSQGLMNRIYEFIERNVINNMYGMSFENTIHYSSAVRADMMTRACYAGKNAMNWSLNRYMNLLEKTEKREELDDLERSVVTKLADDVLVKIYGNKAEIIVEKNFG